MPPSDQGLLSNERPPELRASSPFTVRPLGEDHLDAMRALFDACSSGCFCRYWHFEGTKNEWLERCALRPEENARELEDAVRRGDPEGFGLLAFEGNVESDAGDVNSDAAPTGPVLGWMKLAPRITLPKLRRLPVYRSLDLGPEDTTWSIGCMLVRPEARRRGVARALVEGAEAFARSRGAAAIEAYPRRSTVPLHDEEAWQGPESVFRSLGYEAVVDVTPYPVYRKSLAR